MALLAAGLVTLSPAAGVEPGDPPASLRARRALIDRDVALAIRLYEVALAANPTGAMDWYYYACALLRAGRAAEALTALENSAETGYADANWIAIDPDLAPLRDAPRFQAVLAKMRADAKSGRATAASPDQTVAPYLAAQTRFAPYEIDLPADYSATGARHYPLVVLLHGRGMTGASMWQFARDLALSDVIFLRTDAPYAVSAGGGYEYWPAARSPAEDEWMTKAARFTAKWYADIVRDAATRVRADTSCVIIAGFSQGAAAAWMAAMESPEIFTGVAALSGWVLPSHLRPESFEALARHDVAVFIAHGTDDQVIAPARAAEAAEMAAAARVDATLRLYPIGHTASADVVRDVAAWMRQRCVSHAGGQ
jgi:phospholipase/carboxylesterase